MFCVDHQALQHLVDATGAELGFVEAARVQLQAKHDAQAKKLVDQTEQLARLREEQLKVQSSVCLHHTWLACRSQGRQK